jgi:hypothetical protein
VQVCSREYLPRKTKTREAPRTFTLSVSLPLSLSLSLFLPLSPSLSLPLSPSLSLSLPGPVPVPEGGALLLLLLLPRPRPVGGAEGGVEGGALLLLLLVRPVRGSAALPVRVLRDADIARSPRPAGGEMRELENETEVRVVEGVGAVAVADAGASVTNLAELVESKLPQIATHCTITALLQRAFFFFTSSKPPYSAFANSLLRPSPFVLLLHQVVSCCGSVQ